MILRVAWPKRRQVVLTTALFTVLGVVVALLLPPEYGADARIMPEMTNTSNEMVRRLASVAGVSGLDLSETEGGEAVRPDLYPSVLQSTPFQLYLIEQPLVTDDGQPTTIGRMILPETNTLVTSLKRLFGLGVDSVRRSVLRLPNAPVRLTLRQKTLTEAIGKRVSARFDTRSGIITISAKMPDAGGAAAVAQLAMNYLTQYVANYRTEKARQDLNFYAQRLNEARQRYQTVQSSLFRYNDQHRSIVLEAATVDRQRITDELTIAQAVYAQLARQHEQARLKVQERTPVFKVLEPPTVPLERISPKRTLLVLVFAGVGFVVGVGCVLMRAMDWVARLRAIVGE